jgi:hypothetical protein
MNANCSSEGSGAFCAQPEAVKSNTKVQQQSGNRIDFDMHFPDI